MLFISTWRRPSSVKYPRVWQTFERKSKDGKLLKFTIQDLTEDRYEDMFALMVGPYTLDAPWRVSTGLHNDMIGLEELKNYLTMHLLSQNITIICVLNKEECEKQGIKPQIVSFHLLSVKCKTDYCDSDTYFTSESLKSYLFMSNYFYKNCPNMFEKYNVDKMITSMGLYVENDYRLLGISTEMLRVRARFCEVFDVPLTAIRATSVGSQKAAEKVGFKEEMSMSNDEIRKATGVVLQSNAVDSKLMIFQK